MNQIKLALLAFTIVLLNACSSEKTQENIAIGPVAYRIDIPDGTSIKFGFNTNLTAKLKVEAENTGWEVKDIPTNWLAVTPKSGKSTTNVTLTAQENKSVDEPRAAILKVQSTEKDYNYSKDISVSQSVADVFINPNETSIAVDATAFVKDLTINSNVDWSAECDETWLTLTKANSETLKITFEENLSAVRKATISLKRSGTNVVANTISITQSEAGVTGSTDNIAFDVDGETKTTVIKADASWTAYTSEYAWLSVTPENGGNGNATLTLKALANGSTNSRSGFVYIKIGDTNKLSIPISQEGIKIEASETTITMNSNAGQKTIDITANTSWEVISLDEQSWLTLSAQKGGKGVTAIQAIVQDNPNTTTRSAKIVIGKQKGLAEQTIVITQEGKKFSDLGMSLEFPNTVSTQTINIITDGVWNATASESWISLSPVNGTGNGQLSISVEANTEKDAREGKVLVTVGETTKQVNIVQVGRYVNISYDDLLANSNPATINLTVSSNVDWNAISNVSWMTLNKSKGSGNAQLLVSVADNPSVSKRTGTITFSNADETKDITFTQPGRTLLVDCTDVEFAYNGGRSNAIIITTDGKFEVKSTVNWINFSVDGNILYLSVEQNESGNLREGYIEIELTDLSNNESLSVSIKVQQFALVNIGLDDFESDYNWSK